MTLFIIDNVWGKTGVKHHIKQYKSSDFKDVRALTVWILQYFVCRCFYDLHFSSLFLSISMFIIYVSSICLVYLDLKYRKIIFGYPC